MGNVRLGMLSACTLIATAASTAMAGPPNDDCANATPITPSDVGIAYDNTGATTDGPAMPAGCFDAGTEATNDLWYSFTVGAGTDQLLFVNNCTTSGGVNTIIGVYTGGCGALTQIACNDNGICPADPDSSTLSIPVNAGEDILVRLSGVDGSVGAGTIVIDVVVSICASAAGDCCSGNGTPGCSDPICCELICAQDPFCCNVDWDQICADAAIAQCDPSACEGGKRGCCVANPDGDPGCDIDPDCEAIVCAIDPFCCQAVWDGNCANLAIQNGCNCEGGEPCDVEMEAGDADEGEPCGDDTNGGCNSTPAVFGTCTGAIFGTAWADGGTRDTDWYQVDVAAATTLTAQLTSEFSGVTFIVDGIATCTPVVIGTTGDSNDCTAGATASADVGPGTYVIFASHSAFEGTPCGTNNEYRLVTSGGSCDGGGPTCTGDTNGDGEVNVSDLTNVIILWGTDGQQPGIDADTDDDGVVGVGDLTDVILNWGTCP